MFCTEEISASLFAYFIAELSILWYKCDIAVVFIGVENSPLTVEEHIFLVTKRFINTCLKATYGNKSAEY